MNEVSELRRVLDDEMARLQAPPGLESRVLERALLRTYTVGEAISPASLGGRGELRDEESRSGIGSRSPRAIAFVAALLAIAIVATLVFVAHRLNSPTTPAGHRSSTVGYPVGTLHMITPRVGWADGPLRTTDGGVHWQSVGPSELPNAAQSARADYFLDANHAWVTESTGLSITRPDHVVVFRTTDGGRTWHAGASVPATGTSLSTQLEFTDDQQGWLIIDSGPLSSPHLRAIYTTIDGGLQWSLKASAAETDGSSLGTLGAICTESGMTFLGIDTGWLTWDCEERNGITTQTLNCCGPVVAVTHDGGRTWEPVPLPPIPMRGSGVCAAQRPMFTGNQGVLPVVCEGLNGCGAAMVTDDAGRSWSYHDLPFCSYDDTSLPNLHRFALLRWRPLDFIDANTGWSFSNSNDLYRTINGGRDWVVVDMPRSAPDVRRCPTTCAPPVAFGFVDARVGFAIASDGGSQHVLWTTTDGGQAWSLMGPILVGG